MSLTLTLRALGRPLPSQAARPTVFFYLTLALGIVLLPIVFLTLRRRALHDLLSGLVVVRTQVPAGTR